jgi:hypothetical protein
MIVKATAIWRARRVSLVLVAAAGALASGALAQPGADNPAPVSGVRPAATVDLRTGFVNGRRVLGRSVPGVTAALGRPTWREPSSRRYRLGYGPRKAFAVMVTLRWTPSGFRATSVVLEKPAVFDSTMNVNLLALTPRAFARRVARHYGDDLELATPVRCRHGICTVSVASRTSTLRVTFGRTPASGTFLSLWKTAA